MSLRRFALPLVLTTSLLGLSACGGGLNLNPLTWFRSIGDKSVAVIPEGGFLEDQEHRDLVEKVISLEILKSSGGAIIRAKGLPPRLGYWDAELVAENSGRPENGVLTYMFRISEPQYNTNTSRPSSREIIVGQFVPTIQLQNIRQIKVVAQQNSRSVSR